MKSLGGACIAVSADTVGPCNSPVSGLKMNTVGSSKISAFERIDFVVSIVSVTCLMAQIALMFVGFEMSKKPRRFSSPTRHEPKLISAADTVINGKATASLTHALA